eukprot:1745354-Lingulodinium_polyedra.AAC.1
MTGGRMTPKGNLFVFLVRHGMRLRVHVGDLFAYSSGVCVNLKSPPAFDMDGSCTVAEGLYAHLAETVTEDDTWSWPV